MSTDPTIKLNDGNAIPWLAFGTGTALFGKDATSAIKTAIQAGVIHLDGAQAYANEETLGAGIKASGVPRSSLFLTTKLKPQLAEGEDAYGLLKDSLTKLGVDYVDLYLVHSPNPLNKTEGRLKQVWKDMERTKSEGLAKSIGVSNFRVEDIHEILDGATIVPAVNQLEFHPYVWKAAEPIAKLCKENGIVLESYGGLTPIVRAAGGPVDPVLESVAKRLSDSTGNEINTGQVLTKWIIQKGAVVVTTSSKESRIKETLGTYNLPDLTAEEIRSIDEAGSKLHKRIFMKHIFGE